MKLPIYSPTNTALPTRSGAPTTPAVDPTGAGLAAIGAAGMAAATQWGHIAAQEARDQASADAREAERVARLREAAEKAKQQHLDEGDAETALNTARDSLDKHVSLLQHGLYNEDGTEVIKPAGPREFMTEYEKGATQINEILQSQAKTPGAQRIIEKGARRLFGDRQHDARVYSDALAVDTVRATFEKNASDLEQRIGRERDPERRKALEEDLLAMFVRAQGPFKLTELQVRKRKSDETIDTAVALMDAETDPLGTIEKLRPPLEKGGSKEPSPYRLSPEHAKTLAEQIGNRYDRQVTEQETRRKAAQVVIDKEQTEAYHTETSDLYAAAKDKTATADEVEAWRRKHRGRASVDQDYLKLKAILEEPKKPVKEWKSDPKVEARVMAQVELINPTITRDELIRLNESELLDNNDLKYALGRLRQAEEHRRGLGVTAQGQGQEQARRDHAQAEQELAKRILGPDSFFKVSDEKKDRIYGQALKQLRVRSSAYGGKEAPLEVLDSMLPTLLKSVGSQTLMKADEARAGLAFPTETALLAARKAGRISEPYYREQWERFRVIEQAENELRGNAAGGDPDSAKALETLRGGKGTPAGPPVPRPFQLTPRAPGGGPALMDPTGR